MFIVVVLVTIYAKDGDSQPKSVGEQPKRADKDRGGGETQVTGYNTGFALPPGLLFPGASLKA